MVLTIFLLAINLFKLWLSRYLPLLGDEAYYNVWSQHLALSYNDHPPVIAYVHWLVNFLSGQSEFGVRLAAVILILISTWLIYLIAREAFNKKVAAAAAILFNIVPTYFTGGLFLTPEQPLLIFWLLSMYVTVRLFKTQDSRLWYILGLSVGLGLLSKYPMILFLPGLLLYLIISKENRHWLTKKEPYLGLILTIFVFSPVIIWNWQQGFSSFLYHGSRVGSPKYLYNILYFFVLQFLMFSPPVFIFTIRTFLFDFWKNIKSLDNQTTLLLSLSVPSFLAFLLVSPFTMVGGHWTTICYLGVTIILAQRILSFPSPFKRFGFWFNLIIIILINALAVTYYGFILHIPEEIKKTAYTINQQLPQYIREQQVDYVFSNQMGVGSLVGFYGKTPVYLRKGYWKQFDIWGAPKLKRGDDILYFVFADKEMPAKLKSAFKKVTIETKIRLFAKDSNIPVKTKVFICRDFMGGTLP